MTILKTENLTKDFNGFRALDHLSMEIQEGECAGFLGPNGAGKSTTIKILTNLIRATEGEAYINGYNVRTEQKKALADVGAVVETPEFYPYLTPREVLSYLGQIRGLSGPDLEKRIDDVLEKVRMSEWKDKRIGTFSKGMKQRLAIGQALLHDPSLLILDEPTSGLDPRGMVEVREIVKDLKKEGKTIFMSSHLLNEVQEVADTVIMIERGRVILHDRVEALGKYMKSRRLEVTFLRHMSAEDGEKIKAIPGVKTVEWFSANRCHIITDGDESTVSGILKEMVLGGFGVVSFHEAGMPLENLYMDMIHDSR